MAKHVDHCTACGHTEKKCTCDNGPTLASAEFVAPYKVARTAHKNRPGPGLNDPANWTTPPKAS